MMSAMTIAEFLLARIAEAEADAAADDGTPTPVGMWDPDRVLAECEAKRRIAELHGGEHECSVYDHTGDIDKFHFVLDTCSTLRALASVYADHPDYDPAWSAS